MHVFRLFFRFRTLEGRPSQKIKKLEGGKINDGMSGNTSTRATSLLKAISETATSSVLQLPVLVPAKPKVSSKNLSAEMTFTFWLTYATTT
jgi:hypothetical protein